MDDVSELDADTRCGWTVAEALHLLRETIM